MSLLRDTKPATHWAVDSTAGHLDFVIEGFRVMKMQLSLERALSHNGSLKA
jgi:hypothetical protein